MFAFLIHWWVEVLHADRTTSICIRTTTELRARLLQRKTGLSSTIIYSWPFQGDASVVIYSNRQCSSAFCLSLTYCSIYLGKPSVGKVLTPWLFTCAVFILVPSKLQVSLSRLVFRTGYGIRLYGSWSLPFYLLYLTSLIWNRQHWLCRAIIATLQLSRDMTKPTKLVCAQRRLRSAWASAQSDRSLRCERNG